MVKILIFFLLMLPLLSYSQFFNDGQDRFNIQWKRISSENFEVIFPEGFENKANKVANLMEASYKYATTSLNHKPKKISVILHNETVKSNAFLGWAPSRIEMYTTPHQQIYSQDWLEQLAIHEYRHSVQLSKLEAEMPKILYYLFGEQAAAAITALHLPFWFIEGDAVSAETGLSKSGRGRMPYFSQDIRTQLISNQIYSYDKASFGSFKNNIANHYQFGYLLTGGARLLYDKPVWNDVVHHIARNPFSLNAFNKGLKNSVGINKIELYDTVFSYLQAKWKAEDLSIHPTYYQCITRLNNKEFTNYGYSFETNDSTIIALKSSLSLTPRLVQIKHGFEKVIFHPGNIFDESISGSDSLIVWSERLPNIRWAHADGSLVRLLNINTGKLLEFKSKRKLFAPVISPNKKTILVVESDSDYQFYLSAIDIQTGRIEHIYSNNSDYYITPSWSLDGNSIFSIVLRNNTKGLIKIDLDKKKEKIFVPFGNQEIKRPNELSNGSIAFIGSYSGIDNLYAIDSNTGTFSELISSRFGISDYSVRNKSLIFSDYTANGFQLGNISLDSLRSTDIDISKIKYNFEIADKLSIQENVVIDSTKIDTTTFISSNYSKSSNLFRFHSWSPLFIDPFNYSLSPGFSVMSQNLLNTTELLAGYRYQISDLQGEWYAKFRYLGWFPIIEAEVEHGKRKSSYNLIQSYVDKNDQVIKKDTLKKNFIWYESGFNINANVPLNLSKGKYHNLLSPRLKYGITLINPNENAPSSFPNGHYQYIEFGVYGYKILQSKDNDLLPNFGLIADVSFASSLKGVVSFGNIFSTSLNMYLPGLMNNHGISVYNAFQMKNTSDYAFSNQIKTPRGHLAIENNQMYSFGFDYRLPIFYPDLSFFQLVYFKRVSLLMFYDLGFYKVEKLNNQIIVPYSGSLKSTGFELTTRCNLFQFIAPIDLGLRSSYLFDKQLKFDFLFNIKFSL